MRLGSGKASSECDDKESGQQAQRSHSSQVCRLWKLRKSQFLDSETLGFESSNLSDVTDSLLGEAGSISRKASKG